MRPALWQFLASSVEKTRARTRLGVGSAASLSIYQTRQLPYVTTLDSAADIVSARVGAWRLDRDTMLLNSLTGQNQSASTHDYVVYTVHCTGTAVLLPIIIFYKVIRDAYICFATSTYLCCTEG